MEIKLPIHVNLPDDWMEQILDRLRNDPDADWAEVVRCKDCKYWEEIMNDKGICKYMSGFGRWWKSDDFCSSAERREE